MPGLLNMRDPAFMAGLSYYNTDRRWTIDQTTTTTAAAANITLDSIPPARQHMFIMHLLEGTGTAGARMTVNNESGAQYAYSTSLAGGPDVQHTSTNFMTTTETTGTGDTPSGDIFQVGFLADDVDNQKLIYSHAVSTQGNAATIAPRRLEVVGKANLVNQNLTRIDVNNVNDATQTFGAGSNVSSCSIREKPINQPPFWEHLETNTLPEGNTMSLIFENFPNRRYYWLQAILKLQQPTDPDQPRVTMNPYIHFNLDTLVNYAYSYRDNFGAEFQTPATFLTRLAADAQADPVYINMWIANLTNRVKMYVGFSNTIKEGSATAPETYEYAGKWNNTTSEINDLAILEGSLGSFAGGTTGTLWGSRT